MSKSSFYIVIMFVLSIGLVMAFSKFPATMLTESEQTFLYLGAFVFVALTVLAAFKVMLR